MVVGNKRPALADISCLAALSMTGTTAAPPRPAKRRLVRPAPAPLSLKPSSLPPRPPAPVGLARLDTASPTTFMPAAITPASHPLRSFFSDGNPQVDARLGAMDLSSDNEDLHLPPAYHPAHACTCREMAAAAANNNLLGAQSGNGNCALGSRLPVLRRVSSSCLGCGEDLERQGLFRTPCPSRTTNDGLPWGVVDIDNMEILSELPESRVQGYMREYHTYLRHREAQCQPRHDYLENVQSGVTRHMRTILVSWLYEVAHEYDLMPSTLYMTIQLLDRALSAVPFHKDRLQCLGSTCLFMACKFEEVNPPALSEFSFMTDNSVSKADIVATEQTLASAFHFILQSVTPYCFLHRFTRAAGSMQREMALVHYLSELMLLEYWPLQFKPSLRAAAALHLARQTLNRPKHEVWNNALRHYTGYEAKELEPCVRQLLAVHSSAHLNPHFEVVKKKFDSSEACHVCDIAALRDSDLIFL